MLPLANLFMAHFVLKKTPSHKICVAVFIIVAGCVLAGNSPLLMHQDRIKTESFIMIKTFYSVVAVMFP